MLSDNELEARYGFLKHLTDHDPQKSGKQLKAGLNQKLRELDYAELIAFCKQVSRLLLELEMNLETQLGPVRFNNLLNFIASCEEEEAYKKISNKENRLTKIGMAHGVATATFGVVAGFIEILLPRPESEQRVDYKYVLTIFAFVALAIYLIGRNNYMALQRKERAGQQEIKLRNFLIQLLTLAREKLAEKTIKRCISLNQGDLAALSSYTKRPIYIKDIAQQQKLTIEYFASASSQHKLVDEIKVFIRKIAEDTSHVRIKEKLIRALDNFDYKKDWLLGVPEDAIISIAPSQKVSSVSQMRNGKSSCKEQGSKVANFAFNWLATSVANLTVPVIVEVISNVFTPGTVANFLNQTSIKYGGWSLNVLFSLAIVLIAREAELLKIKRKKSLSRVVRRFEHIGSEVQALEALLIKLQEAFLELLSETIKSKTAQLQRSQADEKEATANIEVINETAVKARDNISVQAIKTQGMPGIMAPASAAVGSSGSPDSKANLQQPLLPPEATAGSGSASTSWCVLQ